MRVGLDVGCSLTKMAVQIDDGLVYFEIRPSGDWRIDSSAFESLFEELAHMGADEICATGAGAEAFVRAAEGRSVSVRVPPGDAMAREIASQSEGVRQMLARDGARPEQFLLVSVGSGTSFTLVTPRGVRQYMPGLSVGGLYIMGNCALTGVGPEDVYFWGHVLPFSFLRREN